MSKSHRVIQVTCKVVWILSRILFVCCIVGMVFALIGIIMLTCGFSDIVINNITIKGIIENKSGIALPVMVTATICAMIGMGAELVVARAGVRCFSNELEDETPFTDRFAKQIKQLGIMQLIVSIGSAILFQGSIAIVCMLTNSTNTMDFGDGIGVISGVFFIFIGVLCKYGTEIKEGK